VARQCEMGLSPNIDMTIARIFSDPIRENMGSHSMPMVSLAVSGVGISDGLTISP
jgi:hypothetical protein